MMAGMRCGGRGGEDVEGGCQVQPDMPCLPPARPPSLAHLQQHVRRAPVSQQRLKHRVEVVSLGQHVGVQERVAVDRNQ